MAIFATMDNGNAEEFFEKLLGFGPDWGVGSIELMDGGSVVELALEHRRAGRVECPGCGELFPLHDHARERKWRHLDMLQYETRIRASIPRCDYPECGVRQIEVPWATPNARFTLLFEAHAIEVLQAARSTVQACDLLKIAWSTANTIMKRGVERGLQRRKSEELEHIGMDEKSFRARHRYITSVCDLDRGRVIEVVEGRTEEKAVELLKSLSPKAQKSVKAVALDMWPAFLNAVEKVLPDASIVHDRFHISKHLNEGVNKVRAEEHKKLLLQGDDRLKGTRNLWLWNEDNLSDDQYLSFRDIKDSELKTSKAWLIKESFRFFWELPRDEATAVEYFEEWYRHTIYSKLKPMKKIARMLKKHLGNILTWWKHRITNAVSEGLNSKIQSVKSAARGFHSFESYRTRILFFCGKLDMKPVCTHSN